MSLNDESSDKAKTLSVFVYDRKKWLERGMPSLDKSDCDQLILHQLLAGFPEYVSRQLRAEHEQTSTIIDSASEI